MDGMNSSEKEMKNHTDSRSSKNSEFGIEMKNYEKYARNFAWLDKLDTPCYLPCIFTSFTHRLLFVRDFEGGWTNWTRRVICRVFLQVLQK